METPADAGIGSKVLTCQLFGFGIENRGELMLSGRSPWVVLTAVESALLLLPDNGGSLLSFFSSALLERKRQCCFLSGWPVTVPGTGLQRRGPTKQTSREGSRPEYFLNKHTP